MHRGFLAAFFCLISLPLVWCQAAKDSLSGEAIPLQPILITASIPLQWTDPVYPKSYLFDTLSLQMGLADLGILLQQLGLAHIKDFGPGRLSSLTLRGGSAGQSQIVWNGLPLNAANIGQTDLSSIPITNTDQVLLKNEAATTTYGSGAVTGVLLLINRKQQPGWQWQSQIGQFATWRVGGQLHLGQNVQSSTSFQWQQSQNNYPYLPGNGGPRKPLPHAANQTLNLQQHFYSGNGPFTWQIHSWYQNEHRQIPPTRFQQSSKAEQSNQNLRISAQGKWKIGHWQWLGTFGLIRERLQYQDSIAQIYSEAILWRQLAQIKQGDQVLGPGVFNNQLSLERAQAQVTAYSSPQQRNQLAWTFAWKENQRHQRYLWSWRHRVEWVQSTGWVWAADLGQQWQINPRNQLFFSAHRSYRIPTLNDLFWTPGGNPDLRPETSYELITAFTSNWQNRWGTWEVFAQPYSRWTQNWILWLPENGLWSPENVQNVWARGSTQRLEWTTDLNRGPSPRTLSLRAQHLLTLATNQQTKSPNDQSLGKQLIYTPRHQASGSTQLQWDQWSLRYTHEWTSQRFTTSDNSLALPGFYLQHLHLRWSSYRNHWSWTVQARCQNVLNTDYESVSSWPMPGRYFELGLRIQQHFKQE